MEKVPRSIKHRINDAQSLRRQIEQMETGPERRWLLLEFILKFHPDCKIHVNRRYCLNLNKDKDLQYLVKKGYVDRVRISTPGIMHRNTVLKLNDKGAEKLASRNVDVSAYEAIKKPNESLNNAL